MYNEEVSFLRNIPKYKFDTTRSKIAKVDDFSTIRFDKNNYSVPTRFIRKSLTVKGFANHIYILFEGAVVAKYLRRYGRNHTDYQLGHYIELLDRKPRSVLNARPVKETVTRELLNWGSHLQGGNKEMVKLLRLCLDYGEDKILKIKQSFPSHMHPSVDMIRTQLHEPHKLDVLYMNNEIDVTAVNLAKYDEKYGVVSQ